MPSDKCPLEERVAAFCEENDVPGYLRVALRGWARGAAARGPSSSASIASRSPLSWPRPG